MQIRLYESHEVFKEARMRVERLKSINFRDYIDRRAFYSYFLNLWSAVFVLKIHSSLLR